MELQDLKFPRYAKLAFVLLSLSIITVIIYVGQHIIIPLLLSLLFAILLRPIVIFLDTKIRLPDFIAVFITVVLFVVSIATIVLFVSWQVSDITNDWTKINANLRVHFQHIQHWVNQRDRKSVV